MALFAVHLMDGFLPGSICVLGYAVAAGLAALGCWRLHERDVPRIALTTAAFFVASSIHIKVPPASVHLVLNGLAGILLGRRAGLAILIGLFLQAVLIGHGGMQTLGVNAALQTLPALAVGEIFRRVGRMPGIGVNGLALCGASLSFACVLATVLSQCELLKLADSGGDIRALLWLALHLPVAFIESIVVGFLVQFLARVKPELIGLAAAADWAPARAERECDVSRPSLASGPDAACCRIGGGQVPRSESSRQDP